MEPLFTEEDWKLSSIEQGLVNQTLGHNCAFYKMPR